MPLITIGVTTFNAASSVGMAIDSALNQTHRCMEIIVVDDTSGDDTVKIVQSLAKNHPQIRLIRNSQNLGVAASRNRLIEEAKGEFIAFFDDDDISDPTRIERQLKRILDYEDEYAGGEPVICHTARKQVAPDGTERIEPTMGQLEQRVAPHAIAVARRILAGDPLEDGYGAVATCSQMARTKTHRDLGGFDEAFRRSEDTELCVRLALAGGHFVGIADPLVTQNLTHTGDKNLQNELEYSLALLHKHKDIFDNPAHHRFCHDWMEIKYSWLSKNRPRFAAQLFKAAITHPLRTWQRVRYALPSLESNRAFARFHAENEDK